MIEDSDKEFFRKYFSVPALLSFILVVILITHSGCKTVSHLKKSTSDSSNVHKEQVVSSKTDSSGSKTDKATTKETVYYPQPIYIQGKDGETKVVFVPQVTKETGTEKTEEAKIVKDESWRAAFDSLSVQILALSQDKKKSVLNFWQIIAIAAIGLMFLKTIAPTVKNLLTKIKIV